MLNFTKNNDGLFESPPLDEFERAYAEYSPSLVVANKPTGEKCVFELVLSVQRKLDDEEREMIFGLKDLPPSPPKVW